MPFDRLALIGHKCRPKQVSRGKSSATRSKSPPRCRRRRRWGNVRCMTPARVGGGAEPIAAWCRLKIRSPRSLLDASGKDQPALGAFPANKFTTPCRPAGRLSARAAPPRRSHQLLPQRDQLAAMLAATSGGNSSSKAGRPSPAGRKRIFRGILGASQARRNDRCADKTKHLRAPTLRVEFLLACSPCRSGTNAACAACPHFPIRLPGQVLLLLGGAGRCIVLDRSRDTHPLHCPR
jgi:hypothetical protein